MVGDISPHAYRTELLRRGGSLDLLSEIRRVEFDCSNAGVYPFLTLNHLCSYAKVPLKFARSVIVNSAEHYKTMTIAKRSGHGSRKIHAPNAMLKSLQTTILRKCTSPVKTSQVSFAFEEGRGAVHAARMHIGARSVVKVDIRDFFGSVSTGQVYDLFHRFGYPELLCFELAALVTLSGGRYIKRNGESGRTYSFEPGGFLPQGAPTSGRIANLRCANLDRALLSLGDEWGCVVTRYADDITVSSSELLSRSALRGVLNSVSDCIRQAGFELNAQKTSVLSGLSEFKLLGLCVGKDGVWLTPGYKDSIRVHLYCMERFGFSIHARRRGYRSDVEFLDFIWGHYSYARGVDPKFALEMKSVFSRIRLPRPL